MTAAERIEEVARLLGLAILRRQARLRDERKFSEIGLEVSDASRPDVPVGRN